MTLCHETITVRGRDILVWRGGAGHPLLFLHDAWTYRWLPIHQRLSAQYEVILPVHPGFAGSNGFEEMDRMDDLVFHYLDLIEVLGLEQPILMGASLGGWIACELAIRYAGLLRAVIFLDPLGLRVPEIPTADIFQLDAAQLRAALFADATLPVAHELVPDVPAPESIEAMLKARQVLARFAWQFPDNPKLSRYLYRVTIPTLIIWGEQDAFIPSAHGYAFHNAVVGSELVQLPQCGHLPHVEQPGACLDAITAFLNRHC